MNVADIAILSTSAVSAIGWTLRYRFRYLCHRDEIKLIRDVYNESQSIDVVLAFFRNQRPPDDDPDTGPSQLPHSDGR